MILAIDPGCDYSAWAVMDDDYAIIETDKCPNDEMFYVMRRWKQEDYHLKVVIEMVASYGMPVGREVFDTCVWIGRFIQLAKSLSIAGTRRIYRQEEKLTLCHSPKANDATIRRALIDRFATHDLRNGRGTKKNPDTFYGVKADMWAAIAVGVTYLDKTKNGIPLEEDKVQMRKAGGVY